MLDNVSTTQFNQMSLVHREVGKHGGNITHTLYIHTLYGHVNLLKKGADLLKNIIRDPTFLEPSARFSSVFDAI